MYGPMNPPAERCTECDQLIEVDEVANCYFTGGGPCGDCRDPRTNKPPYPGGCFQPLLCVECAAMDGVLHGHALLKEKSHEARTTRL